MSSADPPGAGPSEARARLQGLLGLTSRLSEPLAAEEVARVVVDQAQAAVGALTAIMWTVDDPPTHATLVRAVGHAPDALERLRAHPARAVAAHGRRDAAARAALLRVARRVPRALRGRRETSDRPGAVPRALLCVPAARRARPCHRRRVARLPPRARLRRGRAHVPHRARPSRRAGARAREPLRAREEGAPAADAPAAAHVGALLRRDGRSSREARHARRRRGARARGGRPLGDRRARRTAPARRARHERREPETFRRIPIDSTLPAARVARERRALWCESERDLDAEHPSIVAALGRGDAFRAYGALPLVRHDLRARRARVQRRAAAALLARGARIRGDRRRALRRRPRAGAPVRRCTPHGAPPQERARAAARRRHRVAAAGQHARLLERRARAHLADRWLSASRARNGARC